MLFNNIDQIHTDILLSYLKYKGTAIKTIHLQKSELHAGMIS